MLLELPVQHRRQKVFHGLVGVQILHHLVRTTWICEVIVFNASHERQPKTQCMSLFLSFRALGSAAMFPVLQWRWSNDELLSEVVPQLAYSIEGALYHWCFLQAML